MSSPSLPVRTRVRSVLRVVAMHSRELGYDFLIFGLLKPAARFLPRSTAMRMPSVIGSGLAVLRSGREARAMFERAFPDGPHDPVTASQAWLALQYRDYLVGRRALVRGMDTLPGADDVIAEMSDQTRELLDGDRSVMVAMAHVSREASYVFFREGVTPRRLLTVVAPMPVGRSKMETARLREQFGQLITFLQAVRPDNVTSTRGSAVGVKDIIERSSEPGWGPNIHIDAPLLEDRSKSFRRPFAGYGERTFATGTARIARLAQLPILLCIPYLDKQGRTVLSWSDPIDPPAVDDVDGDRRVTSLLLDEIELAVGRRPEQYVFELGSDRRWDPATETWVAIEPAASVDAGAFETTAVSA